MNFSSEKINSTKRVYKALIPEAGLGISILLVTKAIPIYELMKKYQ